ncbi:MAG: TIGR03960 family B12-binding radical SAM protein [Planctomycetales bacterium]|nr:TIGR03960 family B12-binding radical SAM protein [Planctomycetales bacterium]NIM08191.1 TIGR03960 family B12-binding radical SAM protein [Planctomycetales bacterium]NIN07688.1 TIGR03960 family B12-binding radical SAM protein [Planctomycetales bacterium]NIN76805.1 TIGR03960 family B12-binding radical SAM protein [Planctomycetales bacterium]NIO34010.1 TIGR03960 family B12-binding radical SAM protein [Planctomycetales bacterium]
MKNDRLKDYIVRRILHRVQMPAQYLGGEMNVVRKDHGSVAGKLCLAFPDAYTIGMSHHGLQVLYTLMNARPDWVCERVFAPWPDMESALREADLPLYGLESFTPLADFDVLGVSLQYEVCYTNLLTILDLGGIALHAQDRTLADPLVLAGGPCAQNPEPVAIFLDLVVTGDGEPSLPAICDLWLKLREEMVVDEGQATGDAGRRQRERVLAQLAAQLPFAYAPRFYEPEYFDDGRYATLNRTRTDVPETIEPAVIGDLDAIPLPTRPIVPFNECVHDRIAIEIMRGCPWQCRFCQSTVIKRPLRIRQVDTIVDAALESYRNTGYNEISLLSLSTSDYPHFEELVTRMQEVFQPLGVNISVPSLRVNEQLKSVARLIPAGRRNGLTLAPEVARDDMREQIRKKIKNQDLYDGCRVAFRHGFQRVKLYFMCGLPGERPVDLDGIVEMSERIARIGKEEMGRYARVTASVSNFVPKAHTPYQWNGMQQREYLQWAHRYLRNRCRMRSVQVKCHDVETSLLEGVLSRGDRRTAAAIELAWRRGARMDSWSERFDAELWWSAMSDAGVDVQRTIHQPYEMANRLPWDHVNVKYGRPFLEKEQRRSVLQLREMAGAK